MAYANHPRWAEPIPADRGLPGSRRHPNPDAQERPALHPSCTGEAEVRDHVAEGAVDVVVLLADGGDVVHGGLGGVEAVEMREDPGGEVRGGEAATGRGEPAAGVERLVEDVDAGCDHPGLAD